jgi:hypothetical protein
MNNQEIEKAGKILEAQNWTFAKTMPQIPHWWSVKKDWEDKALFRWVVEMIKKYEVKKKFGSRYYGYFIYNGYQYWTMDKTIDSTNLINRSKV